MRKITKILCIFVLSVVVSVLLTPQATNAYGHGGSFGEEVPADQEIQDLVNFISPSIRENIENSKGYPLNDLPPGSNSNLFQALSYKSQTVAGKNYFIKIGINGDNNREIWHAKIYEHWSGDPVEVLDVFGPTNITRPIGNF